MSSVDERIVQMQFENQQFESGIQTSIKSLDNLKKSLKLDGVSNGLKGISDTAGKISLSGLTHGLGSVNSSILQIAQNAAVFTTVARYVNQAEQAVERLVKALTIEPISTGFSEYEEKINSVQTILMSARNADGSAVSLDQVKNKLEELNLYADKTIYSFKDMTSNIGKFTNAGVDLDTAVKAIQGISNEAALSGANAQEASRAMYNFAQALSAGYVKLIDWKSIENANMATVGFKEELLNTAVQIGTVTKDAAGMYKVLTTNASGGKMEETINATHMFNDSLAYQWMTTDVLTTALAKYSDEETEIGKKAFAAATEVKTFTQLLDTLKEAAQSGWSESWELIVGDYEEAKKLWTSVSDVIGGVIGDSAEARNSLLKGGMVSGWDKLIKQINAAGVSTDELEKSLTEVLDQTNRHGFTKNLLRTYGSFEEAAKAGAISSDIVIRALEKLQGKAGDVKNDLSEITEGMKLGDASEDVKKIQQALMESGQKLDKFGADGIFGSETQAALKAFQEAANIEVTGVLDKATLEALSKATENSFVLDDNIRSLVEGIDALGGREIIITGLSNLFESLSTTLGAVSKGFRSVFPPMTVDGLMSLINGFEQLTEKLTVSSFRAGQFEAISKGISSVFAIIFNIIGSVGKGAYDVFSHLVTLIAPLGDGFLKVAVRISNAISRFNFLMKTHNVVGNNVDKITAKINGFADRIANFISKISGISNVSIAFKNAGKHIENAVKSFEDWLITGKDFSNVTVNLKKSFVAFREGVKNTAKAVKNELSEKSPGFASFFKMIDSVKLGISNLLKNFNFGDKLKGFGFNFDPIKNAFSEFTNKIKSGELFDSATAKINGFFSNLQQKINTPEVQARLAKMSEMFQGFKKNAGEIFGKLTENISFEGFINKIKELYNAVKTFLFGKIDENGQGIPGLFDKIQEKFSGFIAGVNAFKSAIGAAFSKGKNALSGGFDWIKTAVLMLVGTFMLLQTAGVIQKARDFVGIFTDIRNTLNEFRTMLSERNEAKKYQSIAAALLSLAVVIGVLAFALYKLSTIQDTGKLIIGAIALVGVITLLGVLAYAVARLDKSGVADMKASSDVILKLSGALALLAASLWLISKVDVNTSLIGKLLILGIIITALGALSIAINKFGGGMVSVAPITGFAGSLFAMVAALWLLSKMNLDGIGKSMIVLLGLMGILIAVSAAMAFVGKHLGTSTASSSAGMLALSASLILMIGVIKLANTIKKGEMKNATVVILGMSAFLIGLSIALRLAGTGRGGSGAGILAMTMSLLLLVGLIKVVNMMDPADVLQGVIILGLISTLFIIMAAALRIAGKNDAGDNIKTLLGMAAAFAVLTGCIYALSKLEPGNIVVATACISLLALMTVALAKMSQNVKAGMTTVLGLSAMIGLLSYALYQIATLDVANILAASVGLSIAMVALAAVMKTVSGINPALAGEGAISLIVFGGLIIAAISVLGEAALLCPDVANALNAGSRLVGEAIGNFVGGLVDGFHGDTSFDGGGESIADKVKGFIDKIVEAGEALAGLSGSDFSAAQALATTILTLAGAEVLDAISAFIGGGQTDFGKFADGIGTFATAMKDFATAFDGVSFDEGTLTSVTNVGQALANLNKTLPRSGGKLQDFIGSQNMEQFSTDIGKFADAMKDFSTSFSGITFDEGTLMSVTRVGQALANLNKSLPKSDGKLQEWLGSQNMSTFSTHIVEFGYGMKLLSNMLTGEDGGSLINEGAIESAKNMGSMLSELENGLSSEGGVTGFLFGNQSLSEFGTRIEEFGQGLVKFNESLGDTTFDQTRINGAIMAATSLSQLENSLSIVGTTSVSDIATFVEGIEPTIGKLQAVFDQLDGLDPKSAGDATSALADFAVFLDAFGRLGSSESGVDIPSLSNQISTSISNLDGLTLSNLAGTASQLDSFHDALSKITLLETSNIDIIVSKLSELNSTTVDTSSITSAAESMSSSINDALSSSASAAGDSAKGIGDSVTAALSNVDLSSSANSMINSFSTALTQGSAKASAAAKVLVNAVTSSIRGGYDAMAAAGRFLDAGLAGGIASGKSHVIEQAKATMRAAVEAAKREADINSPSRVMMEVGKFFDQGLALGITQYGNLASRASESAMGDAIHATSEGIANLSKAFSTDIDSNPTIRPVLDLSEIRSGASTINGMFGSPTLGFASASIGSITTSMNQRNQNAGYDDVVNAVNNLGDRISGIQSNTYNVNGVTYDDGSNVTTAIRSLVHAAKIERRI